MLKRDFTLFIRTLAGSAVLLLLLATITLGAAAVMIRATTGESDQIRVAIVDNEDSVLSRILIHTVSDTEYIRSMISVETMEEEEAHRAVRDGSYAAAILLPKNFVSDIAHGQIAQGQVYLSPALASQGNVIASTVRFGERLMITGQYGVFAGEGLLRQRGADRAVLDGYLAATNTGLLAAGLAGADTYFTNEDVSYANSSLSADAYFALSALTAVLFLLSVFFTPLFMRDCTRDMLCRLASYKIGPGRYMLWKIVYLTLLRFVLCAAALLLLRETLGLTPDLLSILIASLFITVVGACLIMCTGDGITANALVTLAGMLLCGGLIPLHLLPDSIRQIGRLTPFGAAQALLAPLFGAPVDWLGAGIALLYTVLSLLLIHRKLRHTRMGRAN